MTNVGVEVDPRETAALVSLMRKRRRLLDEDMSKTVIFTAWFVGRAAAAAVKTAPKLRRIIKNPRVRKSRRGRSPYTFAVKRYRRDGSIKIVPVKGKTRAEAKLDPRAQIGRRGLAKDAWSWILQDLGKNVRPFYANKKKAGYIAVEKNLRSLNPYISMTNRLSYASLAFKTKGRATINNIMSRANNAMRKDLERRAGRTIKATA